MGSAASGDATPADAESLGTLSETSETFESAAMGEVSLEVAAHDDAASDRVPESDTAGLAETPEPRADPLVLVDAISSDADLDVSERDQQAAPAPDDKADDELESLEIPDPDNLRFRVNSD